MGVDLRGRSEEEPVPVCGAFSGVLKCVDFFCSSRVHFCDCPREVLSGSNLGYIGLLRVPPTSVEWIGLFRRRA